MERLGTPTKAVTKIAGMMLMMLALFILFPSGKAHAQDYGLWVNNVQVTDENKANVLGDANESVKFDSSTNTLSLNGAIINDGYTYPDYYNPFTIGIYSTLDRLSITGSAKISGCHTGILQNYSEGVLNINGDGAGIVIDVESFGIRRITSKSYDVGSIILGGNITVSAKDNAAITTWGSIEIQKGSVISAANSTQKYGMISNRGDIIVHGGTVTAKGTEIGIGQYYEGSKEYAGNIEIEGGTVSAASDKVAMNSYKMIDITGGTVTAKGGYIGVRTLDTISIGKNIVKLTATGTDKAVSSYAMQFSGNPVLVTPVNGDYNGLDILDSAGAIAKKVIIEQGPDVVRVSGVKLNITSKTLLKGDTLTLKATVSPSNATNKSVTWSSSNTKVATVKNGVVTAIGKGTANITVKTKSGGKTAVCKITVKNPVAATGVKLNKKTASVEKGKSITLKATISPSNTTNKAVTFKSSNKKIATVDKKGVVTGVKPGKVTITVTTANGKKATCTVTVVIKLKSFKYAKSSYSVKKGKTITPKLTFSPKDATNKEVTYKSSNTKVATVDKNGKVTAKKKGKVKITATSKENKKLKAECEVIVK